jgi:hypothetical protein
MAGPNPLMPLTQEVGITPQTIVTENAFEEQSITVLGLAMRSQPVLP